MMLNFQPTKGNSWRAAQGKVAIFVDDASGQPDAAQVALAHRLAANMDAIEGQGARYLDLFVDRARACGRADEEWWFDEIDLRGLRAGACLLSFTLDGDDGGLWRVEFADRHSEVWPIRFERLQG